MIVVGLLGALFTIFVGGFGITMPILARRGRINVVECGCLAWLFGCGVVSLLLWLAGTFCTGFVLQSIVTIALLALGIVGWRAKRNANAKFALPRSANMPEWILGGVVLVEMAVLLFASFKHTLGWDGLLNWEIKARYAFLNSGVLPASYYSSAGRTFSHPEYPLGIPFTELWLYLWMGEPNQFWIKIIFPLFYAAGTALLALTGSWLTDRRWIGLLTVALLVFVPFVTKMPGGILVGYVDLPLSLFYVAALGYLLCWFKFDDRCFLIVFAAVSALLPWMKSEGLILWFVLALVGGGLSLVKNRASAFLISVLPGLTLIFSWRIYLKLVHTLPPADFSRPSVNLLRANVSRFREISGILFAELRDAAHWSIFWLLVAVALVYLFGSRKLERIALASAVILPILLYSLTYLFSAWPSYVAHMTSSLPRLLLHVMPAGWLAIGLALGQIKSETRAL